MKEFIQNSNLKSQVNLKFASYSAYNHETWMIQKLQSHD